MQTAALPCFDTARLRLRPRRADDLQACLEMDCDPEVTRYIPGPWKDPARHRAFVVERLRASYPAGFGYWTVLERAAPDRFLGWILLLPYRAVGEEVEIGWRLRRACWGRGYAVEAAAPVIRHACTGMGIATLVADIHAENRASIRVAEKLGFRFIEERNLSGLPAKSYQLHAPARES